uniref:C-type lectin domain-containing protein n=1 Tax=Denticeps clupeoides TaxID=299321 RepID=A0A8C4CLE6_9TELE
MELFVREIHTNLDADNMNKDHIYDKIVPCNPHGTTGSQQDGGSNGGRSFSRWAAVCLGLLCILLLGLVVWMTIRHTAEKEELLARLPEDRNHSVNRKYDLQNNATDLDNRMKKFKKLFRFTYPQTWNESRQYCQERGGDLVVIRYKWEHMLLNEKGMNGWLGLTDQGHDGTWRWVDGSPLTLQFWRKGEPAIRNGRGDCVVLHTKKQIPERTWSYYDCSARHYAVCEEK